MTKLTIKQLKDMFIGGGISIANEFEYINQLNIFPVPDGDTGSNMKITTEGASNSIKNTNFNDLATLGKTYSRALLMNARGNSGVIFSQIMKGFVSSFKPQSNEITLEELNNAFTAAKEQAYKTLSSPIEGTILTVIRMTADGLHQKTTSIKTVEDLFAEAVKISQEVVMVCVVSFKECTMHLLVKKLSQKQTKLPLNQQLRLIKLSLLTTLTTIMKDLVTAVNLF